MRVEKNRKAYRLANDVHDKTLLTLVEELDGWSILAVGWEYSHWYEIGERGGLAEAGELNIEGRIRTSIEHYIQIYRQLFNHVEPIHHLFKSFAVTASIKLETTDNNWTSKKKRKIIEEFEFIEKNSTLFEKHLSERHYPIFKYGYCNYSFQPIGDIKVLKPELGAEQISLF